MGFTHPLPIFKIDLDRAIDPEDSDLVRAGAGGYECDPSAGLAVPLMSPGESVRGIAELEPDMCDAGSSSSLGPWFCCCRPLVKDRFGMGRPSSCRAGGFVMLSRLRGE